MFSASMILYYAKNLMIKISMKRYYISAQELMYYYSLVTVILMYINLKHFRKSFLDVPPDLYKGLILRCVSGFFSDIFLNLALVWTGYGKATIIAFLSTIMVPIFATCMIGDRIKAVDIVAIIFSFTGMVLIV